MAIRTYCSLLIITIVSFFLGCEKSPSISFQTEADLAKVLVTNMSQPEVLKSLGRPTFTKSVQEGYEAYDFFFPNPAPSNVPRTTLGGVTVYLRNEKVTHWSPIYHQSTGREQLTPIPPQGNGPAKDTSQGSADSGITIWTVTGEIGFDVKSMDPNKMIAQRLISEKPALVVSNLKGAEEGTQNLILLLNDKDAEQFRILTGKNKRRQLLLMINSKPIIAPMVPGEISNGMLQIPFDSTLERDQLRKEIQPYVPK